MTHPNGWACPDCEDPLHEGYDDETEGAITVCQKCLAIISSEGGKIRLLDYHKDLSVTTRCMIISGISMSLMNMAMDALQETAKDSEAN